MTDDHRPASGAAAGRPAGSARPTQVARHAVPDPHARAVRGPQRRGPVAHRGERRHDPPGGRHRVPRRCGGAPPAARTPAPTSRANGSASRAGCAARSSRRARRASSPRTPATRTTTSRSAGRTRSSRPNYGSPFVRDLDNGRRYGTIEDFRNFVKLAYLSPAPPPQRRDGLRAGRRAGQQAPPRHGLRPHPLQRQAVHGLGHRAGAGARHGRDGPDPVRRRATSRRTPRSCRLINANSPLVWDSTMLGAARAYAEANQATLLTPFILAGAMSPVTVAGAGRPDPRRGARPG